MEFSCYAPSPLPIEKRRRYHRSSSPVCRSLTPAHTHTNTHHVTNTHTLPLTHTHAQAGRHIHSHTGLGKYSQISCQQRTANEQVSVEKRAWKGRGLQSMTSVKIKWKGRRAGSGCRNCPWCFPCVLGASVCDRHSSLLLECCCGVRRGWVAS